MAISNPDFVAILRRLVDHHVDFIVVGGVCAVLHGAPIATFDLDVVHSRKPDNLDRLLAALETLDAHYREPVAQKIKPTKSHLASSGHQLLMTSFGPLDLLGTIGADRVYDALLSDTLEIEFGRFLKVRLLSLSALIKIKEETGGEKDKAVLPILRSALAEKTRFGG